MLTVYPDYYPEFRCLADKCRHTCCAGWEIDVDGEALEKYRAVPGETGDKLRSAVAPGPEPHFILTEGGRCPFLTAENLCELILHENGGQELLCRICRDHPRWRSFLPGRTEVGVGLCCEAAAALILSRTEPVRLVAEGGAEQEDGDAQALLVLREAALAAAQDRKTPLAARMEAVLALCGAALPYTSLKRWAAFYRGLERLDKDWTRLLDRLEAESDKVDITSALSARETEFEQLFVYFLHRHFLKAYDDGDVTGKAAFAVLSTRMIAALCALDPAPDLPAYARMYSSEIEYSDDNLNALYDALVTPWTD